MALADWDWGEHPHDDRIARDGPEAEAARAVAGELVRLLADGLRFRERYEGRAAAAAFRGWLAGDGGALVRAACSRVFACGYRSGVGDDRARAVLDAADEEGRGGD